VVYQETLVQRNQHRIYVREYPGEEPTIILMHGFPDNLHLYDRPPAILIPLPVKSVTSMPSSPNCGFSK
jgi:pimeloyl-ACP methyl ester carboxylesterase